MNFFFIRFFIFIVFQFFQGFIIVFIMVVIRSFVFMLLIRHS